MEDKNFLEHVHDDLPIYKLRNETELETLCSFKSKISEDELDRMKKTKLDFENGSYLIKTDFFWIQTNDLSIIGKIKSSDIKVECDTIPGHNGVIRIPSIRTQW